MTALADIQRLARELDAARAALPRVLWPLLLPAAEIVIAHQWGGVSDDGRPMCLDCRRLQSYGTHPCSCPTGRAQKRFAPLLAARAAAA